MLGIGYIAIIIAIPVLIIKKNGFASSKILGRIILGVLLFSVILSIFNESEGLGILVFISGSLLNVFIIAWIYSLIRNHLLRNRMRKEEELDLMREQNRIMSDKKIHEVKYDDPMEKLEKLAKLKDMGAITEDEFKEKKKVLMDRII